MPEKSLLHMAALPSLNTLGFAHCGIQDEDWLNPLEKSLLHLAALPLLNTLGFAHPGIQDED